ANRNRALGVGRLAAVHEEQVQKPVAVKVKKGYTSSHGFDQIPVRRFTVDMPPGNSGLLGDFGKRLGGRGIYFGGPLERVAKQSESRDQQEARAERTARKS